MGETSTEKLFEEMQTADIMSIDINTLVDIQDVFVDPKLPQPERAREYLRQMKNPFCYRDGDVVVKIRFSENNITLEERLEDYLSML